MSEPGVVVCVDFGSTFTKAALVDLAAGRIAASASHPTTLPSPEDGGDVLDGFDACLAVLVARDARARDAAVLACSSAGGGLRIAVVGNEELVTSEAGRRVALSSGGKVVHVGHGGLDPTSYAALTAAEPDVLLLVGGTDGGNAEVLEADAELLAARGWPRPVVVAGNVESQGRIAALFEESGTPHVPADNVVPCIGVLAPESARAAIREMFLAHVIGGKHLSERPDFTAMVRGATPDVVLTGVELLARGLGPDRPGAGDVVVVDVGGATTDVHSVVEIDPEEAGLSREVVAVTPVTRTVEGDLGMRWSAPSTVEAAGLADLDGSLDLVQEADRRRRDPGLLPADEAGRAVDEAIARAAVDLALRRHAGRSRVVLSPDGRVVERSGKDLREVDLLVASGGVLRNGAPGVVRRVVGPSTGDVEGGWQLPRAPRVVVDRDYVLAAVGLLADAHPEAAYALARGLVESAGEDGSGE
ncbi:glutamate mutase L [Nocardioides gansuensis]|uniref:glutamate mutase L n=1 Tax=Nocardioides gansuensis TaxID=2138300 RepID=UPI001FEC7DC9|nr:glutamate mutase L [Nocardioides gansuensis]